MATSYNIAEVRELLTQALTQDEFDALCFDHFRAVADSFSDSMSRSQRTQKLLEYCDKHVEIEKLLDLVRKKNPTRYAEFAPRFRSPVTLPTLTRRGRSLPTLTLIGVGAVTVVLLVIGIASLGGGPKAAPTAAVSPTPTGPVIVVAMATTPTAPTDTPIPPTVTPTATAESNDLSRLELAPGVVLEMVRVPAGEFLMGSDKAKDPQAYDDELPQHRVNLAEYWIGKYEVTNGQFGAFVTATGYKTTAEQMGSGYVWTGSKWEDVKGAWWQAPQGPGSDINGKETYPVVLVSWHDAVAFGAWASQVTGRVVRLPSEAEWEKAARGADERIYPWGNEAPDCNRLNYWGKNGGCVGRPAPVGSYADGVSPYGAYDLAGNVWEWVSTKYRNYPYAASDGREDQNKTDVRLLRSGGWESDARRVRSANRNRADPSNRGDYLGFRLAAPGL